MKLKWLTIIGPAVSLMLLAGFTTPALAGTKQPPPGKGDFIATFDTNGDGRVSKAEFPGPDEHFTQLDTDENGYLSADEAPEGPPAGPMGGGPGQDPMEHLDKDGDGRISQEEFPGPDAHFTQLDEDGDGYLSEDELPKGPPPMKQ